MGINMNLAPVLDLSTSDYNPDNDPDLRRRAARAIKEAAGSARIPRGFMERVCARLRTMIRREERVAPRIGAEIDGGGASLALAEWIAAGAVEIAQDPKGILPIGRGAKTGVLVPRLWDVADRVTIDDGLRGAAGLVQGWVRERSGEAEVLEISVQPGADLFDLTFQWVAGLDVVVFFCHDAHRHGGQRRLLEELQARCPKLVVVLIRNPWDANFLGGKVTVIQTYGFRLPQLSAAVRALFGTAASGAGGEGPE